jgi:NADH-quinone oxidoreductase E subunit
MTCCATQTDNWPAVEAAAKATLGDEIVRFIDWCQKQEHASSQLIAVLHMVQERHGYLAPEKLDAVAQLMHIPAAKVSGVATFYHFFRLQPRGKFAISVCMGTACYVNGADKVAAKVKEELGIDFGQTTTDGRFSLNSALCLGTCGLAPVVMVNDQVYPKVTPDQVPALLEKIVEKGAA